MAIIDVVTFNSEYELFEIRYNILKDIVDKFIVIEFDKTFSGKKKESTFNQFYPKVEYHYATEDVWNKYWEESKKSPATSYGAGAEHWLREWSQKESIKYYLTNLKNENTLYIGDVDEIWQPFPVSNNSVFKLKLRVYTYFLNNRSSEQFCGTIVGKYKNIKDKCLNNLRQYDSIRTQTEWGWHFTSMHHKVREKLTDSYTDDTYATKQVLDNLEDNIKNSKDFLGRDFKYKIDESELPKYLLDNKEKYKHLFK